MSRTTSLEAAIAVKELGFPELAVVSTLRTIAHLFGTTKQRCGIYLLGFPENRFYIGQAVDVVRRFAQHRRIYSDIVGFSFIPARHTHLSEVERTVIHKAESLGLTLLNTIHATNIVGETDLDFVVSRAEQEAWLSGSGLSNVRSAGTIEAIVLPEAQVQRFAHHFCSFNAHPHSDSCLAFLRSYVNNCLVYPRRTEYSFWAVSCMPSTNRYWPRLACVNAAVMELFVVGYHRECPDQMWGFVNVASDVLDDLLGCHSRVMEIHPDIEVYHRDYRDAGQHQASLQANNQTALRLLMESDAVRRAAATLSLRVMRKRATIYGKFHCKQLADSILCAEPHYP
jgi:hypothetical protein